MEDDTPRLLKGFRIDLKKGYYTMSRDVYVGEVAYATHFIPHDGAPQPVDGEHMPYQLSKHMRWPSNGS